MSDPAIVTASELIRDAESRAEQAERHRQFAVDEMERERARANGLLAELQALGKGSPPDDRETAKRFLDRIYHGFENANWNYDQDEYAGLDPGALREMYEDWLAAELTKRRGCELP